MEKLQYLPGHLRRRSEKSHQVKIHDPKEIGERPGASAESDGRYRCHTEESRRTVMTGRSYHNLHKYSDYHTSLISRRYVCKDYKQTGFSTVMETVANFCTMIGNLKQAAHQLMPAHGSSYQLWELMRMKDGSTPLSSSIETWYVSVVWRKLLRSAELPELL